MEATKDAPAGAHPMIIKKEDRPECEESWALRGLGKKACAIDCAYNIPGNLKMSEHIMLGKKFRADKTGEKRRIYYNKVLVRNIEEKKRMMTPLRKFVDNTRIDAAIN